MKASELKEIEARDLGWGETDGAVSINTEAVAKRLNEMLLCLQTIEARADRHWRPNARGHSAED